MSGSQTFSFHSCEAISVCRVSLWLCALCYGSPGKVTRSQCTNEMVKFPTADLQAREEVRKTMHITLCLLYRRLHISPAAVVKLCLNCIHLNRHWINRHIHIIHCTISKRGSIFLNIVFSNCLRGYLSEQHTAELMRKFNNFSFKKSFERP